MSCTGIHHAYTFKNIYLYCVCTSLVRKQNTDYMINGFVFVYQNILPSGKLR